MAKRTAIKDDRRKWNALKAGVRKMSKNNGGEVVQIGVFAAQGSDLVKYATKNEFGLGNVPERSFLRGTEIEKRKDIKNFIKRQLEAAVKALSVGRGISAATALKRLGLYAEGLVKNRIRRSKDWAVPNAPSTIEAKSTTSGVKDQPLVDTGRLISSIVYRIAKLGGA